MRRNGGGLMNMELNCDTGYVFLVEEGAALFDRKEYASALSRFWQAFRVRPSAPVVLFNIARAMEELEDARAEDFYAAAATHGNTDALYQLATLYLCQGCTEEAIAQLRAFLMHSKGEDEYTRWARSALQRLSPGPVLVCGEVKVSPADHSLHR